MGRSRKAHTYKEVRFERKEPKTSEEVMPEMLLRLLWRRDLPEEGREP